ncbi:RECEPTOR-LIKE PROTEIN 55 [Salix purpurea]|uniref:RECEPTOR-LIKE PROTEIN 55 n=1 Tax=Salix purpurea TaxID=77065 RepID=A0A9Q0SJH2_SALPP|nr:RECEPTOR-LIKE PROTEIN 55 [Salix purpurea]
MKSPYSLYGRRTPASGAGSTPDRVPYSPSPSYSSASTVKKRNPLSVAAKSMAGVFVACFTPPEPEPNSSKDFGYSEELRAPSVSSNTSGGNERRRSSNRGIYSSPSNSVHGREPGSVIFTMEEIYAATRNFSPTFKIGQGGFGTVYKGRLQDGTVVAIKRAKKSVYDKHLGVEFQSEIKTLARVEHLNLVKFYGYLEHGDERIVLVEYVANGTLREHLDCIHGNFIDLAVRLDVAIDVAHAITYLHMYTGRRPIEAKRDIKERITARWAVKKFAEGNAISILDPKLECTAANNLALEKILELALQCLAPHRQNRPSMRKCAEILWSIRKDYKEQSASDFRSLSSKSQGRISVISEE